jgi:hypothetical protein
MRSIPGYRRNYAPRRRCQISANIGSGSGSGTRATAEVAIDAATGNIRDSAGRCDHPSSAAKQTQVMKYLGDTGDAAE